MVAEASAESIDITGESFTGGVSNPGFRVTISADSR
jgi:hypothetical protein